MNNKLDLIFEKEPPEVQQKLIGLLIQYNAMMQYNQKEDKFQVDLLLPFKTTKEKEEFVNNYKKRNKSSSKKEHIKYKQHKNENEIVGNNYFFTPSDKQNEKSEGRIEKIQQKNLTGNNEKRGVLQNHIENIYNDREDSAEISYELTNENESIRRKTITFKDISSAIKHKIRKAVEQIKSEMAQNKANFSTYEASREMLNNQGIDQAQELDESNQNNQKIESIPLNNFMKKGHDETDQIQSIGRAVSPKIEKQLKPNFEMQTSSYRYREEFKDNSLFNSRNSGHSSEIRQQILIEEERNFNGEEEYHPGNNYLKDTYKKSQASSFPEIIQQENEEDHRIPSNFSIKQTKNYLETERQSEFKQRPRSRQKQGRHSVEKNSAIQLHRQNIGKHNPPIASKKIENQNNVKQKLNEKYSGRKVNSSNLRQKYTQFMKKNHRDFDRIYETIKKQIKRNESKLSKHNPDDPILVLEEGLSDSYSEEDRIFKQEIIKDYQKHIIAHNQNMSSEDLVKYFRYLLQNAKNLYIKHIRKGK